MISSVNLQEVKIKLFLQLKDTGWDIQLRSFLLGTEMDHVLEELLRQSLDGRKFTPPAKLMFRALTTCHFDNVKVVVLGQD